MNTQKNYRYRLSRSPKKHICPDCRQKSFTYYEDTETGEELPDFGRCDRQDKCGCHRSPTCDKTPQHKPFRRAKPYLAQSKLAPAVFIPDAELEALRTPDTLRESQFFKNMVNHGFSESLVLAVFNLYKIGALDGCTAFPYIDRKGGIRVVSLIEYGANNRRVKKSIKPKWLHSWVKKHASPLPDWVAPYTTQGKMVTALFGEHLLDQYPSNPLNVVEAPKTAIIAAAYYGLPTDETTPIWVAVGARDWLYAETVSMLAKERERRGLNGVKLWPDLSNVETSRPDGKKRGCTFEDWEKKGRDLLVMSAYLEDIATDKDRIDGLDLADFLWGCPLPSQSQPEEQSLPLTITSEAQTFGLTGVVQVAFFGDAWEEVDENGIKCLCSRDGNGYTATIIDPIKDDVHATLTEEHLSYVGGNVAALSCEKSKNNQDSGSFSKSSVAVSKSSVTEEPSNTKAFSSFSSFSSYYSQKSTFEPSPMSAYFWRSGKKGKTYLMPDDQKWIDTLLPDSIDNRTRSELMQEHQRLYLETYQQEAGSKLRKDEIARRSANLWLLNLIEA